MAPDLAYAPAADEPAGVHPAIRRQRAAIAELTRCRP